MRKKGGHKHGYIVLIDKKIIFSFYHLLVSEKIVNDIISVLQASIPVH